MHWSMQLSQPINTFCKKKIFGQKKILGRKIFDTKYCKTKKLLKQNLHEEKTSIQWTRQVVRFITAILSLYQYALGQINGGQRISR